MSKQNETESLIELQDKILTALDCCSKYDFNNVESRINYFLGFFEEDYNCICDLLNYAYSGSKPDIPF